MRSLLAGPASRVSERLPDQFAAGASSPRRVAADYEVARNMLALPATVATFSVPFRSPKLPCARFGGELAQLVERDNGIVEVRGSIPLGSTKTEKGSVSDDGALCLSGQFKSCDAPRLRRHCKKLIAYACWNIITQSW